MVRELGQQRNSVKPQDRTSSAEGNIENAKSEAIKVLTELHEMEAHKERRTGESGVDYSRTLRNIQQLLPNVRNAAGFYDILFQEGVSPGVIERLGDRLNLRLPNQGLESYVKTRFFGAEVVSDANLRLKPETGGKEWFESFITEQLSRRNLNLGVAHRVQTLARDMSQKYGSEAAATTRLMFMSSSDELESGGGTRYPDPVARLEKVVTARKMESPTNVIPSEKNFFEDMRRFLGVYADITANVIRSTGNQEVKVQIDKGAKRALSHFLRLEEFQSTQWNQEKRPPNPFNVFREMLLKEQDMNPWLVDDCRDTPFDVGKFGLLMSEDVPRGLVAEAARFLNNHQSALYAEKVEELLKSEKKTKKNENGTLPEGMAKKVKDAVAKIQTLNTSGETILDDDKSRIKALSKFVEENLVFSKDKGGIHPFTVLLRTVDTKKIVTHDQPRQEFNSFLSYIPSIQSIIEAGSGEIDEDAGKKIAIIASSVKEFLDNTESYMDIPILSLDDQSIRTLLTARSQQSWFDEEVLRKGPYAYMQDKKNHPEEPLIQPRDLSDMSENQIQNLKKNFDTAKGVDTNSKRKWISRACAVWNDIPNSYNTITKFALRQAERFYNTQGKYGLVFYPSATWAMNDVVSRLFPRVSEEDYIIISNQEYNGMTDAFTNHGASIEAMYCNDRARGKAKDINTIFSEMVERIDEGRKRLPSAVILSSKTRFGDALGVAEGKKEPNSYGLGDLIKKLKDRYPGIPVIVDGCQSIGRNDRGENNLERLGCDIYVNSGAKALGIENVAMLAVRKAPEGKEAAPETPSEPDGTGRDWLRVGSGTGGDHWLSHIEESEILKNPIAKLSPGKSTIDIRRVAALGIAFQIQNSRVDSWKVDAKERSQTQRERIANRMQELTKYAIAKTSEYPEILLTNPEFPFNAQITDSVVHEPAIQKQFGCQVVYPVHRKSADYNGILTVTFPNLGVVKHKEGLKESLIRDDYTKIALQREGYLIEQCLSGQNAVRISFHYLHEEKDIDDLFETIAKIHIAFLKKQMEKNPSIDSFSGVVKYTPNTPDTWMEN